MPPDLPTLRALADRLERATGADPKLDRDIMLAVAGWRETGPYADTLGSFMALENEAGRPEVRAPEVTASIDAAVALCERQASWFASPTTSAALTENIRRAWVATIVYKALRDCDRLSEHLPRRICLALVRALIAQQETDHA